MNLSERQPSGRPTGRILGMVAWVVLLTTVALGGRVLGQGALAPPSLREPGTWAGWAIGRTPVEAAFAVLLLVVVALAWYLLAATVLVTGARLRGAGRLVSVVDVLTVPVVRRAVHAMLGVGLVGTSVAGAAATSGAGTPHPAKFAPALELVVATVADGDRPPDRDRATDDHPAPDGDPAPDSDVPVMRLLPDKASPAPQSMAPSPPLQAPDTDTPDTDTPDTDTPDTDTPDTDTPDIRTRMLSSEREVRPGDHLWSLAVQILDDAGAPAADDGVVITYWRQLIEANLDRLADPDNPDLIFPGQVLAVPAPTAGDSAP